MNRLQAAEQFRKALQMFAASLSEEQAMEVATIYDPWVEGKTYAVDEFVTYGENKVGDPQLYKVVQTHTSQADWKPDAVASLYVAIGLNEKGYPMWSQPAGAHDAYNKGDIVDCEGTLWMSDVNGNVWKPGVSGWTVYE